MTLKEIFKLSLNRVGEREGDRQIENIIMAGINAGYKLIAARNKKSKSTTISAIANTPLVLPPDYIGLVMLIKEGAGGGILSQNEYQIDSDLILITNPDMLGDLTMHYDYIPSDLVLGQDDDVVPTIQVAYHSALAAYAAYYFYNHKNNPNAATMCLNEFSLIMGMAGQRDVMDLSDPVEN